MLVLKWKERAFTEKVNSICFPAAIFMPQNSTPMWRLHTKLYKGAWNILANNSETVGTKTWDCYISLLQRFIFLASSTGQFPIYGVGGGGGGELMIGCIFFSFLLVDEPITGVERNL